MSERDRTPSGLRIRTAGDVFGGSIYLETGSHACGHIRGGVGIRLGDTDAGFVLEWTDFEAAYLALKAERASEEFKRHHRRQIKEFGPGLGPQDEAPVRDQKALETYLENEDRGRDGRTT